MVPSTNRKNSGSRPKRPITKRLKNVRKRSRQRKLFRRWRSLGKSPKLISHCVLYRRCLFTDHSQKFDHPTYVNGRSIDCGEPIQRFCEDNEFEIVLRNRKQLCPYIWHFEAATLNRVLGRKLSLKRRFRTWRFYRRQEIRQILNDSTLDA